MKIKLALFVMLLSTFTVKADSYYKLLKIEAESKISYQVIDLRAKDSQEHKNELGNKGYTCERKPLAKYLCKKISRIDNLRDDQYLKIYENHKGDFISLTNKYAPSELVIEAPILKEYKVYRNFELRKGDKIITNNSFRYIEYQKSFLSKLILKDYSSEKEVWLNKDQRNDQIITSQISFSEKNKSGYEKYFVNLHLSLTNRI